MVGPMQEITQLLSEYFDALYNGDVETFARIFHPDARLYSANEAEFLILDVPQYLKRVAGRPSPAARGDRRADEILSVAIAGPATAHARVRELFLPRRFTDELTLLRHRGRWQIISKVWDFEVLPS